MGDRCLEAALCPVPILSASWVAADGWPVEAAARAQAKEPEPPPVAGVNSEYGALGPQPTPDGNSIYCYSDRPGGRGGFDLWVVHRSDESGTTDNFSPAWGRLKYLHISMISTGVREIK